MIVLPALWPALVPLLCLLVDLRLGEPSARWHPVVWMGHYLQALTPWVAPPAVSAADATGGADALRHDAAVAAHITAVAARTGGGGASMTADGALDACLNGAHVPDGSEVAPDWRAFWRGTLAWWAGALVCVLMAGLLDSALLWLPGWGQLLAGALLLKPLMSWAMLRNEAQAVEAALLQSLPAGRERLRWLVSRDTRTLGADDVREATIETLAENLNDSVVAPLFWFAVAGLPGAALYRFANTADAMWGYPQARGGREWSWAGKWAARVDDVLGWLPARLTALLLMAGARRPLWRQLPLEARCTPSPNGGWPMAAMALRLGCRLGKPGSYCLNSHAPAPGAAQLPQALHRAGRGAWWSAIVCVVLMGLSRLA